MSKEAPEASQKTSGEFAESYEQPYSFMSPPRLFRQNSHAATGASNLILWTNRGVDLSHETWRMPNAAHAPDFAPMG